MKLRTSTKLNVLVSTVDLKGIEHDVGMYYETGVIEEDQWEIVERYPSYEAAADGHLKWVRKHGGFKGLFS